MERDYRAEVDAHWDFINKMAGKSFWKGVVAEKAALSVINALAKDDWAILKKYRGDASFDIFIKTVALTELEKFAEKTFGRCRPPLWVIWLGGMWKKLYIAMYREGATVDEATKFVCANMAGASSAEVQTVVQQLLRRITNLEATAVEIPFANSPILARAAPPSPDRQSDEALTTVCQLVLGSQRKAMRDFQSVFQTARLSLSLEERLFLKMCYQDGLPVARAGCLLGMGRFKATARMRRLLARLRREFVHTGLYQAMLLLLQDGRR